MTNRAVDSASHMAPLPAVPSEITVTEVRPLSAGQPVAGSMMWW